MIHSNMIRRFLFVATLATLLGGCLAQVEKTAPEGEESSSASGVTVTRTPESSSQPIPWGPTGAPPVSSGGGTSGVSGPPAAAAAQVSSGATNSTGQAESPR
ncbi:MAG TPA: hypothetical protein VGI39_11825 [Polyangiaceae bacterium]